MFQTPHFSSKELRTHHFEELRTHHFFLSFVTRLGVTWRQTIGMHSVVQCIPVDGGRFIAPKSKELF
jgi:hypothetical protein